MASRERFAVIDIWITLLLCLVILGHCSVSGAPEYYTSLKTWIYSFHMAAFYFVCGFLIRHVYRPLHCPKEYGQYIFRKLIKFGIPFLFFGILFSAIDVLRAENGNLSLFVSNLLWVLTDTAASPSIYLWFIYVLFEYYLLAPIICQFYKYAIIPAFAIAVLLQYFPLPRLFSLHQFSHYFLFLLIGIVARELLPRLRTISLQWAILPTLLFPFAIWKLPYSVLPGLLSLPALWLLSLAISQAPQSIIRFCQYLSQNCFTIYLWQMLFVHAFWIAMLRFLHCPFWSFLVLVIPVAIIGSLASHKIFIGTLEFVYSRIHSNR